MGMVGLAGGFSEENSAVGHLKFGFLLAAKGMSLLKGQKIPASHRGQSLSNTES